MGTVPKTKEQFDKDGGGVQGRAATLRERIEVLEKELSTYRRHLREKIYVNATPDVEYPIRILEAHIDESTYSDNTAGIDPENWLCMQLNADQKKRNKLLRKAIRVLRKGLQ